MGKTTGIAWCDHTFNPWIGCTKVSPGCDHCYAAVSRPAKALGINWGRGEPRHRTSHHNWQEVGRWNAAASRAGQRRLVFCASLADVFDNEVPIAWLADLWTLIDCTQHLTWLLLTKRIGNARSRMPDHVLPNVWLGASVVNQEEADRDIPKLLATPAAKRFVSYEPALGPVDFTVIPRIDHEHPHPQHYDIADLDWIIVGGESSQGGAKARPFDIAWARSTVAQCKAAGVPVFVKQLGSCVHARNDEEWDNWPDFDHGAVEHDVYGFREEYKGALCRPRLRERAGADPAEWPEDLRVQEFPT